MAVRFLGGFLISLSTIAWAQDTEYLTSYALCTLTCSNQSLYNGLWNLTTPVSNLTYLTATLKTLDITETAMTFYPNTSLSPTSNYTINLFTPGCIQDNTCFNRGTVNITGLLNGTHTFFNSEISQVNGYDKFDEVYFGNVPQGEVQVWMEPLWNDETPNPFTVVAQGVQFALDGSTETLGSDSTSSISTSISTSTSISSTSSSPTSTPKNFTSPSKPSSHKSNLPSKLGIGLGVPLGLFMLAIIITIIYLYMRKNNTEGNIKTGMRKLNGGFGDGMADKPQLDGREIPRFELETSANVREMLVEEPTLEIGGGMEDDRIRVVERRDGG